MPDPSTSRLDALHAMSASLSTIAIAVGAHPAKIDRLRRHLHDLDAGWDRRLAGSGVGAASKRSGRLRCRDDGVPRLSDVVHRALLADIEVALPDESLAWRLT